MENSILIPLRKQKFYDVTYLVDTYQLTEVKYYWESIEVTEKGLQELLFYLDQNKLKRREELREVLQKAGEDSFNW